MRKEAEAMAMREGLMAAVRDFEREQLGVSSAMADYRPGVDMTLPNWLRTA